MIDTGLEAGIDLQLGTDSDPDIDPVPDTDSVPDIDSHLDIPETDSAPDTDLAVLVPDSTVVLHFAALDNTAGPDLEVDTVDFDGLADRGIVRQFAGCFADDAHLVQL